MATYFFRWGSHMWRVCRGMGAKARVYGMGAEVRGVIGVGHRGLLAWAYGMGVHCAGQGCGARVWSLGEGERA